MWTNGLIQTYTLKSTDANSADSYRKNTRQFLEKERKKVKAGREGKGRKGTRKEKENGEDKRIEGNLRAKCVVY